MNGVLTAHLFDSSSPSVRDSQLETGEESIAVQTADAARSRLRVTWVTRGGAKLGRCDGPSTVTGASAESGTKEGTGRERGGGVGDQHDEGRRRQARSTLAAGLEIRGPTGDLGPSVTLVTR